MEKGSINLEGQDLVAYANGVEVFRARAGAIVERAYGIVEAVKGHEDPFKVESHVRNNRRYYFVKAGDVVLKESVHAGKIHDFADRLNGVEAEPQEQEEGVEGDAPDAPQEAEPAAPDAPQEAGPVAPDAPQEAEPVDDLFADE